MSFENDTTEEHERRVTRCRSCNARIIFLTTSRGRKMPVEADSVEPDDEEFDAGRHESHFARCKAADQHRRPR